MFLPLVGLPDVSVDEVLPVAMVTTLDEVVGLVSHASQSVAQLEGPQEVVDFLEVGSDGVDLVDQVLDADDVHLAERLLDDRVVGDGDALVVDLSMSTFVHELFDALEVGVSPGDERLDQTKHVQGGLVQLDEHSVVDLSKTKQLQSFLHLGAHLVDTPDTDDKGQLSLRWHVEVVLGLGDSLVPDFVLVHGVVLLGVLLSALENNLSLELQCLLLGQSCGSPLGLHLLLGCQFLCECWGNHLENQM